MSALPQVASAAQRLTVSVIDTRSEFNQLEPAWNKLLWASPRPVPFLTWEWVSTWWKHFGGSSRLWVLVARNEQGHTVGIAPLKIARRKAFGLVPVRTVEFIGYLGSSVCADHLDFLTAAGERRSIVEKLVEAILTHRNEWDSALLADLAENSLAPEIFNRRCLDEGFFLAQAPAEVCPYVELAGEWPSFLGLMKGMHRSLVPNIKRYRERLSRNHQVCFRTVSDVREIHAYLDTLAKLHGLSRQRQRQKGNFRIKEYRNFHYEVAERMAAAGHLYAVQLDCDNLPAAALYGYHLGDVLFYYQAGFDVAFGHLGVGSVLLSMVLQDAIERLRATEFDFLRGAEQYKYRWARHDRHTRSVICWRKEFAGALSREDFWLRRTLSPWRERVVRLASALWRPRLRWTTASR